MNGRYDINKTSKLQIHHTCMKIQKKKIL